MPALPRRQTTRTPYWLRFSLILATLGATTSAFVLIVLPRRFVLNANLIESGITFPTGTIPFWPLGLRHVIPPTPIIKPEPIVLGPAEAFWNEVVPLLDAEEFDRAQPVVEQYLAEHPDDADAWREYAVVLLRIGNHAAAEQVYLRLIHAHGEPADKLALARLLRDQGRFESSLALYRGLVAADPSDAELHHELAQTLAWGGNYREATYAYRALMMQSPDEQQYRLELAQVLWWNGYPANALKVLRAFPGDAPQASEAAVLRAYLDSLMTAALPPGEPLIEQARRAVGIQDLELAAALYRRAIFRNPADPDLWLEWADFQQLHQQDLAAARDALIRVGELRNLESTERFRLAQLYSWNGQDGAAEIVVLALLDDDPEYTEAWVLLGDLYLWQGHRIQAAKAYRQALARAPTNEQARFGLASVRQQTAEAILERERPRAGPEVLLFQDSDDFLRLDVMARASYVWSNANAVVRSGYRRIEGVSLDGTPATEKGPFLELEIARWWRMGTVRTSLATGLESFDGSGTEPTLEVRMEIPDIDGTALTTHYRHGRAFPQAVTLESVLGGLLADQLQASFFRQLDASWALSGAASVAALHGTDENNVRLNLAFTTRRALTQLLSAAITSQVLTFGRAAPILQGRRLYWDPSLFWSNGLQLAASSPTDSPLQIYVRITPGMALMRERAAGSLDLVPQLGTEGGVGYETDRIAFRTDVTYLRGREGDYNSFGANIVFAIKY
jgi:tetratricopeptide (TPR) repeat protein